jgi:hypothetical protein
LNYTRIYPGAFFEREGLYIRGNTLGVKPEDLVLPWARSSSAGYAQGGNLFDLDRWDGFYINRLKDFIGAAEALDIIVEICFFNAHNEESWSISPLFHRNNVQQIGFCRCHEAQTLRDVELVSRQDAYVRRIVEEVNPFDNVILEICDEPIIYGSPCAEALEWVGHLAGSITDAERKLPKKHLIAQQVEGGVDLSGNAGIQVVTSQYVWEAMGEQMGGMQALECKYGLGKPIELNETYYFPVWYFDDAVAASRVEAWEFMLGGGAGFNHLNGAFTADNPEGNTEDSVRILDSLRYLKEFLYRLDFIAMRQDKTVVKAGVPQGAFCRVISQPGRQYALYLHHSKYGDKNNKGNRECYIAVPGSYSESMILNIAEGNYWSAWIDPESGRVISEDRFSHSGGERIFKTPVYAIDIALFIQTKQLEIEMAGKVQTNH